MMLRILSLCLCLSSAVSFTTPGSSRLNIKASPLVTALHANPDFDNDYQHNDANNDVAAATTNKPMSFIPAIVLAMIPNIASAAGPDWGLFEGRTGSLLHPAMMFSLLAYSIATAVLGFQWRRQRTMGDEISSLKAQIPKSEDPEAPKSAQTMELESQVAALQAERKELASANPRDKHFSQGALLAFLGTAFAIEVGVCWFRTTPRWYHTYIHIQLTLVTFRDH